MTDKRRQGAENFVRFNFNAIDFDLLEDEMEKFGEDPNAGMVRNVIRALFQSKFGLNTSPASGKFVKPWDRAMRRSENAKQHEVSFSVRDFKFLLAIARDENVKIHFSLSPMRDDLVEYMEGLKEYQVDIAPPQSIEETEE